MYGIQYEYKPTAVFDDKDMNRELSAIATVIGNIYRLLRHAVCDDGSLEVGVVRSYSLGPGLMDLFRYTRDAPENMPDPVVGYIPDLGRVFADNQSFSFRNKPATIGEAMLMLAEEVKRVVGDLDARVGYFSPLEVGDYLPAKKIGDAVCLINIELKRLDAVLKLSHGTANDVSAQLAAVQTKILGGETVRDTLKKVSDAVDALDLKINERTAGINSAVRFDVAQSLSADEAARAMNNIGMGAVVDFAAVYAEAKK